MLSVRTGVVAATVSLTIGTNEKVDGAGRIAGAEDHDRILLFGSSDLLLITRKPSFEEDAIEFDEVSRSANWYYALSLDVLGEDRERPRPFRGFAFFRLHRPRFERPSIDRLGKILEQFHAICDMHHVTAEVSLGYGWADLYLDLRCDSFTSLFATVAACRVIELENHPVFRNSFTIVGVDLKFKEEASRSEEAVRPSIALRVEPSDLQSSLDELRTRYFSPKKWRFEITSGKRDIVITAKKDIPFSEFWRIHERLRALIGAEGSPIHKVETHLQFPPRKILPRQARAAVGPTSCNCSARGATAQRNFTSALLQSPDSIGIGLKQSYRGLANLYRETLEDRDSCCDFDAAAAHFFSQSRLLEGYGKLCDHIAGVKRAYPALEQQARQRAEVYRQAFDRLDISSMIIFQQEQNGSYFDLLTRSERVSLFRGGMQKINTVLLTAIASLVERHELPVVPMLCWWPAGQIQSERPIAVIKVPVFFLHRPETALFLIIHELGQITTYEYLRTLPERTPTIELADENDVLKSAGISPGTVDLPSPERYLGMLEERFQDHGILVTDVFADFFLLRVGFAGNRQETFEFLFEQFLRLEQISERESADRERYCKHLVTRLVALQVGIDRMAREPADVSSEIDGEELDHAWKGVRRFLNLAVRSGRYQALLDRRPGVDIDVRNEGIGDAAREKVAEMEAKGEWLRQAIRFAQQFALTFPPSSLTGMEEILEGNIVEIEPSSIAEYFRELLNVVEEDLFYPRTALTASVLSSCEPVRRLPATPAEA